MSLVSDFENAIANSTPPNWSFSITEINFLGEDKKAFDVAWKENDEIVGQLVVTANSKINGLIFDYLNIGQTNKNVFKNLCGNLPAFARKHNLTNFVIIEESQLMRSLLNEAGFIIIDTLNPVSGTEDTVISLIEQQWTYFGPDVFYADVKTANSALERYAS